LNNEPEGIVVNDYELRVVGRNVVVLFMFWLAGMPPGTRTAVWIPRSTPGQTVLRERKRLNPVMRHRRDRDYPMRTVKIDQGEFHLTRTVAANAASMGFSEVGSCMRIFWFEPMRFDVPSARPSLVPSGRRHFRCVMLRPVFSKRTTRSRPWRTSLFVPLGSASTALPQRVHLSPLT
jgi:hypothetical protein